MTIEAKKKAFKSTWAVFIPTVILCWIICCTISFPAGPCDRTGARLSVLLQSNMLLHHATAAQGLVACPQARAQ